MSRQGGKLKPLKAPKKDKKDEDEDDKVFKEKKKAEEAALKAAKDKGTGDPVTEMAWPTHSLIAVNPIRLITDRQWNHTASKGGAPGGGIKKSGKK